MIDLHIILYVNEQCSQQTNFNKCHYDDMIKIYFCNHTVNNKRPNSIVIHFMRKKDDSIYVYNTEQMTAPGYRHMINEYPDDTIIIDYSYTNADIIKNKKIIVLPMLYHRNILFKFNTEIEYDVCIIGGLSSKRRYIYDKLKEEGINIININGYGDKRDREISKCKVLLNIHKDNTRNVFEFFRCSQIVFNKIIVVSEYTDVSKERDINKFVVDHCIFSKYDKLVDDVIDVIENYKYFKQKIYDNFDEKKLISLSKQHIREFNTFMMKVNS